MITLVIAPVNSWFLPNPAAFLRHHRLAGLAHERLLELRHVHDQTVDAEFARRVGIGQRFDAQVFGAVVFTGPLRIAVGYASLNLDE